MKRFASLFVVFLSLSSWAYKPQPSYDLCEANSDGVMLYYNYIYVDDDVYCELTYGNEPYAGQINVPDNVTDQYIPVVGIGVYAFSDCQELTSVYLPYTVLYIDAVAFWRCNNLEKVHLGSHLMAIGELAFESCNNLAEINIPQSLEFVGYLAFNFCSRLGPLYNDKYFFYYQYPQQNGETTYSIPEGIEIINTSAFSFSSFSEIIIPNTVKVIKDNAFDGSMISRVTIPPSVVTIEHKAFGQTHLMEVTVPATVKNFGDYMFDSSLFLQKAVLENPLDSIPIGTFHCCTSLESVTFPETVHKIGSSAFSNNMKLLQFDFSNIDTIYDYSFYRCESFKSITIPPAITYIPEMAFCMCSGLTEINLPETLKGIGLYAFWQNRSLESIDIPASVTEIGMSAFTNNTNMKDATVHWDMPIPLEYGIFDSNITLHVPAGTKQLYAEADVWKEYMNIVDDATPVIPLFHPTVNPVNSVKRLIDGKILIERNKHLFNLNGVEQ